MDFLPRNPTVGKNTIKKPDVRKKDWIFWGNFSDVFQILATFPKNDGSMDQWIIAAENMVTKWWWSPIFFITPSASCQGFGTELPMELEKSPLFQFLVQKSGPNLWKMYPCIDPVAPHEMDSPWSSRMLDTFLSSYQLWESPIGQRRWDLALVDMKLDKIVNLQQLRWQDDSAFQLMIVPLMFPVASGRVKMNPINSSDRQL